MSPDPTDWTGPAPAPHHAADPWTSKATARRARLRAGTLRYLVLEQLERADYGATAYELAVHLGELAHSTGTRLGELVELGYAEPLELELSGTVRRPTDTGRLAVVHVCTEAGRLALHAARPALEARTSDRPRGRGPAGRARGGILRPPSRRGLRRLADRMLEELVDAGADGLTDAELAARLGILRNTAGTGRKHLEELGLVERTDRHRTTDRGAPALVHVATPAGAERLYELAGG